MERTMVKIDGDKLRKLIAEKGYKMVEVSDECGMSHNYIANCCGYGTMRRSVAKLMEMKYDIPISDYEYVEPTPEPIPFDEGTAQETVHEETVVEFDIDEVMGKIREAVREGMLDAITAALNDSNTRGAIYGLIASAQKGGMQLAWNEKLKGAQH